jgi:hypothetical protein
MPTKPRTRSGYDTSQVQHVRATCLYIATKLGDMVDEVVIVGGLVPGLLIDQEAATEKHVGTADLDLGLALAVFDDKRYQGLTERLRQAGFGPDTNEKGNPTRQRWRIDGPPAITVDFLIPPTTPGERGGRVKDIEQDFAAIIAPGLRLAFHDRVKVSLEGRTIRGEEARREVWVCGPGAFVAMKSLAFRGRGENKDAYDLVYFLRNHAHGIAAIAAHIDPFLSDSEATEALQYLDRDFATVDSIGPRRVAEFLFDARNEEVEADAWGAVRDLLDRVSEPRLAT